MIPIILLPLLIAVATAYIVIRYQHLHERLSHDHDLSGVQKFHTEAVPRIGGVVIALALLSGLWLVNQNHPEQSELTLWLMLSALPVFAGGLIEDLTNKVSPKNRLLLAFLSAAIAFYELNYGLQSVGWGWFDQYILTLPAVSLTVTIFMVGGVSHATNIIDGFNGLLLGFAIMALSIFGGIAWQLEDQYLLSIILTTIASLLGLLPFNFPKGGIFTGDGGAYLIGFLLATLSLLLVMRHPQLSSWLPLLVLSYPVVETIFSIYRKKFLRGISPGSPDGIHLHMLVYKRIVPHYFKVRESDWRRNALTAVAMWIFTLPALLLALFWWDSHFVMVVGVFGFVIYYIWFYFLIVRFKSKALLTRYRR